jgi:hypothetical protein
MYCYIRSLRMAGTDITDGTDSMDGTDSIDSRYDAAAFSRIVDKKPK